MTGKLECFSIFIRLYRYFPIASGCVFISLERFFFVPRCFVLHFSSSSYLPLPQCPPPFNPTIVFFPFHFFLCSLSVSSTRLGIVSIAHFPVTFVKYSYWTGDYAWKTFRLSLLLWQSGCYEVSDDSIFDVTFLCFGILPHPAVLLVAIFTLYWTLFCMLFSRGRWIRRIELPQISNYGHKREFFYSGRAISGILYYSVSFLYFSPSSFLSFYFGTYRFLDGFHRHTLEWHSLLLKYEFFAPEEASYFNSSVIECLNGRLELWRTK